MNTTSLFVELVVIGVGAAIWVVLLIFTAFGYEWVPSEKALSIPAAIPILAVVYVLGIVSDRMIDILFDYVWGKTFRKKHFPRTGDYHEARRKVLTRPMQWLTSSNTAEAGYVYAEVGPFTRFSLRSPSSSSHGLNFQIIHLECASPYSVVWRSVSSVSRLGTHGVI